MVEVLLKVEALLVSEDLWYTYCFKSFLLVLYINGGQTFWCPSVRVGRGWGGNWIKSLYRCKRIYCCGSCGASGRLANDSGDSPADASYDLPLFLSFLLSLFLSFFLYSFIYLFISPSIVYTVLGVFLLKH